MRGHFHQNDPGNHPVLRTAEIAEHPAGIGAIPGLAQDPVPMQHHGISPEDNSLVQARGNLLRLPQRQVNGRPGGS